MLQYQTNQIFIYPIKSVGPVTMASIELDERGLKYDRHWMLVYPDGRMISQREFPQLNKIICSDENDCFKLKLFDSSFPEISFKKLDDLKDEILVSLWSAQFNAYKTQEVLAEWFSDYLSEKIYIVTKPDRKKQLANFSTSSLLNFQDGSPVHLVNLSSVSDLSKRCGTAIDHSQFRANIYLDFETPYFEDDIREIEINGILFRYIKPCERCAMSTVRPFEDRFNKEPLLSLSKYRKGENEVKFGIYLGVIN
jgi:uncharacterized protein YcbX